MVKICAPRRPHHVCKISTHKLSQFQRFIKPNRFKQYKMKFLLSLTGLKCTYSVEQSFYIALNGQHKDRHLIQAMALTLMMIMPTEYHNHLLGTIVAIRYTYPNWKLTE